MREREQGGLLKQHFHSAFALKWTESFWKNGLKAFLH